ncbi:MAG: sugar phosphate isomerase/epimerase family protein [Phycisphaerae bacterium]
MPANLTRRELLAGGPALAVGLHAAQADVQTPSSKPSAPFIISLNTSTLRGHKLPIARVVDIAAETGYQGIEPWVDELDRHVESGGTLADLNKRIKDHGLKVTGAIAFFEWMVDDDTRRIRGLDDARRRMEQLAQIGATHIAAPPAGDVKGVDLLKAAERYRALLEMAEPFGVIPAVEIWGSSPAIHRLGQAVLIAIEAHHPKACILPDVFHLYRGGSDLADVAHLNPHLLGGFHLNDYPADPPRDSIADKHRVHPGDGIAPLKQLIRDLRRITYTGSLSIELFNPDYYRQDPLIVARTSLDKTRALIRQTAAN